MYVLGNSISSRYDSWSKGVQNNAFSGMSEAIYTTAAVFNTAAGNMSWLGTIMWYL